MSTPTEPTKETDDDHRSVAPRSRWLHGATFLVFTLALTFPWIAGALGASSETVERRNPTAWPDIDRNALVDVETFQTLNGYVRDHTPLRGPMTARWSELWLTVGASSDTAVMEGPGDVMFLAEDFIGPCNRRFELTDMVSQFEAYNAAADAGGKEWLFLVAPDKGAVLDAQLTGRAAVAAECSRDARADFRAALDSSGASFDLAPLLIDAEEREPGEWYYEHDSHWTFAAGDLVADRIVDHFQPGLFEHDAVVDIDRSLPIRGDIFGRLGILKLRESPDPFHESIRADVNTELVEEQIGGTRTLRSYRSLGVGPTIPGSTIVVHDSMMNFVEGQLASYFDDVVFIHWNDLTRSGFVDRVAVSDRVIFVSVERSVNSRISSSMLSASFSDPFMQALSTPASRPDPELPAQLIDAASALRSFVRDTGALPADFDGLLTDPGVDGWAGPYLDRAVFSGGEHPHYGSWELVTEESVVSGDEAAIDCGSIHPPPCRPFVSLGGVARSTAVAVAEELDGGGVDLTSGVVRHSTASNTLYFYPFG